MDYRIEIYDRSNLRVALYDEVPLLEATREPFDRPDRIRGMLPTPPDRLGHGFLVRVLLDGRLFCQGRITSLAPHWGDTKRLILDRYVRFHEVVAFEACGDPAVLNPPVSHACVNQRILDVVKDLVNRAPGPLHYRVRHTAYPDGAVREYEKLLCRKLPANELESGGIGAGQWVASPRVDASTAYAKDGDTVAGLVVDGVPWPDLRLMLIDCEETSLNDHAVRRHPETAAWSTARYDASGYKRRADAARAALQALIDEHGIDVVELNPHRDRSGAFDDRVDAYGRYLGLLYGGGRCFNAALVEQGHADANLYRDGRFLDPTLELKDFFSYSAPHEDSVDDLEASLQSFDFSGGVLEGVAALAYAARGYTASIDPTGTLRFRAPQPADRVLFFDPLRHAVSFGSDSSNLVNVLPYAGGPPSSGPARTFSRDDSVTEYGPSEQSLDYYGWSRDLDAEIFAQAILDDLAYPSTVGLITFFRGDDALAVGDVLELRGAPLQRLDTPLPGEGGGWYNGRMTARVCALTHRFAGREVTTVAALGPPLRTVADPLRFLVQSQPSPSTYYAFRLDAPAVALDQGYHLD